MNPRSVTRGEFDSPGLKVGVDWLAFTYTPPDYIDWKDDLCAVLEDLFGVHGWEERGGWQGYECSARSDDILIAWGGAGQRGTVHVEVPGAICSQVTEWNVVADWLRASRARITRVDIAGDDFLGEQISVDWAVAQYKSGGFSFQGTPPSAHCVDDLGNNTGRTLYVGKRENGKLARIYEKGKALGAAVSRWCRFEVEWRAKCRVLDPGMLTEPEKYLAGAYPCSALFSGLSARVRTFKTVARLTYERCVANARQQCGRAISAILTVTGGDVGAVVDLLRRPGLPKRLTPSLITALASG